jgi:phosphoribosylformylglycinamidine (FGAM) synthase PurS component
MIEGNAMNTFSKRIGKLETVEHAKLVAEIDRQYEEFTDAELTAMVNDSIANTSIADLTAELTRLRTWLASHRAGQVTG